MKTKNSYVKKVLGCYSAFGHGRNTKNRKRERNMGSGYVRTRQKRDLQRFLGEEMPGCLNW